MDRREAVIARALMDGLVLIAKFLLCVLQEQMASFALIKGKLRAHMEIVIAIALNHGME